MIKNSISLLVVVLIFIGACNNKKQNNAAAMAESSEPSNQELKEYGIFEFDSTEYDFGEVIAGEQVVHSYKFKNVGTAPLLIEKATATCGCTVPEFPKEKIPVGGAGEIVVKFNSKNRKDRQSKMITINANTKPPLTHLKLVGVVIPAEKD
jgi:hypothetical protein